MSGPGIDISCDVGESFGAYTFGQDAAVMELVSSANVACGFHAGDAAAIRQALELAGAKGVAVGAHPGLPDRLGFGRRVMRISEQEAYDYVLYQVAAVHGMARALGLRVRHVNLHAALNRMLSEDARLAAAAARAVRAVDPSLIMVAWESELSRVAAGLGLRVAHEIVLDRGYGPDGKLLPRSHPEAVVRDPQRVVAQALSVAQRREVLSAGGQAVPVAADTVRFHIETTSLATVKMMRASLAEAGVSVAALA